MADRLSTRKQSIRHFTCILVASLAAACCLWGCQQPRGPVFAPSDPAIAWPPRPLPAKVLYVGQLTSSEDLKPSRTFGQALGELFVGAKDPDLLSSPRASLSLPLSHVVWIADPGGGCLHRFDLKQRKYLRVTSLGGTRLATPVGFAEGPDGTIFVCDSETGAVFHISARTGTLLRELPVADTVQRPVALYFDARYNELFVVDSASHDIKVFDVGGSLKRIIGKRGSALGEFNFPLDLIPDGDTFWVVDTGNHRIQQISRLGEPITSFGAAGDAPGSLALPKGVAIDSDGHVYVVDGRFENVQVFDRKGNLLLFFGDEGTGPGEFWLPSGIQIDRNDRIWISDVYNRRIQVFDYVGRIATDPNMGAK
jgi:streptogramin lyase